MRVKPETVPISIVDIRLLHCVSGFRGEAAHKVLVGPGSAIAARLVIKFLSQETLKLGLKG